LSFFTAGACSDRGPVRRINEDSYLINAETGLLVVADGMGGHAAGEVASRLAVEAVAGFIDRSHGETEYSWPYGVDPTLSLQGNRLRTAVHLANRRVFRAAEGHDDYTGMGTTVVALLVGSRYITVAHVGDSRVYLLKDGQLEQLTRDDSWAATVLGLPGAEPSAMNAMRNVLTNVLGAKETTDVHVQERRVASGDRVLLCSDGLHGPCDDDALRSVLIANPDPEAAAAALVRAALDRGSRDNVTAIVAVCEE
jgi:PPM family protein phosphatase